MKKRYLLVPIVCAFIGLTTSSYIPGTNLGGFQTSCSGGGCHSGGGGTTSVTGLTLVDQSNSQTMTTIYRPGHVYTVTLTGSNTANLPKFGFQMLCSSGAYSNATSAELISGHILTHGNSAIAAVSNVYTATATWTAPAAGNGIVTFRGIFNGVNGDNSQSGDSPGSSQSFIFNEGTSGVGVGSLAVGALTLSPNPVSNALRIQMSEASTGNYEVQVYNSLGAIVMYQQLNASQSEQQFDVSTANLVAGTYFLEISKDGGRTVKTFTKN